MNSNNTANNTANNATTNFNNGDNDKGISLYIPRVFNNLHWRFVKNLFVAFNWGYVERVDLVHNGGYKKAYIHFRPGSWNMENPEARAVLNRLQDGGVEQVVYQDPWYWMVMLSKSEKPEHAPSYYKNMLPQRTINPGRKVVIDLDDDSDDELEGSISKEVEEEMSFKKMSADRIKEIEEQKELGVGVEGFDPIISRATQTSPLYGIDTK
jgi:hypothetical protein